MRMRNSTTKRFRQIAALAIASTFLSQNFAWAVCSDGTNLPPEGFVIGQPPVVNADNWSPDVFTGTTGSIWVPDASVYENNDPSRPLTGGGHNWVFDQGSTLCKVTDEGAAGALPTGWSIPPNDPTFCVVLPVIVLDEAAMARTDDLARLVAIAERSHSKLVLVGDPHQLGAVEQLAGGDELG